MYLHEYREDSSLFTEMTEMNVNESISMGILVVNDGLACQNKVAQVLQRCNYEVLHTGTVYDALHAIWENKDRFDLVITNAQKLESEGVAIIQNIKERLKLNVLLIRSDERVEPKGELLSFSAYFVNGLTVNGFNSLLENEKRVKEDKMGAAAANQQENVQAASVSNAAAVETNKGSSSIKDAARLNQKWKAMELYRERSEDSNDDHCKGKKLRVTWTNEMHQKFLNAIERLGYDKAVPKKIVEVMGVPGLSRENVASHLQKYRCSMRRTQETIFGSLSCRNTRTELKGLGFLTSPSTSKDLVFGSRLERKFCTRIGGSHLSDVGNMMQCRANKHSSSTDNSSHSDTSKFVGYRFVGNQIDYGPINKINTDAVFSTTGRSEDQPMSYVQHHQISDQNAVGTGGCIQSFLLGSSASRIHGTETSQEPDLLSSYASRIESLLDSPPTQQPHQISAQQSGCSDSLLDQLQSWDSSANAALFHDPSTTSSLVLPPHQDFPIPPLEAPGNGFSGQTPAGFFDDILQQQCSPPPPPLTEMFQNLDEIFDQGGNDDHLINGIGNAHDRFDIQEFDDTFFGQDD